MRKFSLISGHLPPHILKIRYNSILKRKFSYAYKIWFPHIWQSHGCCHLLSAQRLVILLISRVYKKTLAPTLPILKCILPLKRQLVSEAELSQAMRLSILMD